MQNSNPDIKKFLIGNKADLEECRLINREQALQLQKDFDIDFFMETSSKTGMNIQELFVEAAILLYKEYGKYKKKPKKEGKQLKPELIKNGKGCC